MFWEKNNAAKALVIAFAAGFMLIVISCAKSADDGKPFKKSRKIPPNKVATVGMDVCTYCHENATEEWLDGAHANLEAINHTTHAPLDIGLDSDGFPYYDYLTELVCFGCHDPLGDGRLLEPGFTGNVDRPVIGCESCHGGGAQHYGVGQIPFPKPDFNRCGQCHNSSFPEGHLAYHPTGADIVEEYKSSPHRHTLNEHVFADENEKDVRARCSRCHSDEGFRKYVAQVPSTTGHDDLQDYFDGLPSVENASPVQCRTCHDAHTTGPDQYEALPESTVAGEPQSRQFNTCTACHQLNKDDGTVITDAYHDPSVNTYGSTEEIIPDSHAAVPGDTRLNTGSGAQALYYVIKGDENSCAGCHNPHMADNTINEQYAESGHGDPLAEPWTHYDWKNTGWGDCQRCHTPVGMKNLADCYRDDGCDPETDYDPANNDFSYLLSDPDSRFIPPDEAQNQTLYCWACHTNYKGGLRDPGPVTAPYVDMTDNPIVFPDWTDSNLCMLCHTGRESGGTIANSSADFSDTGFINSHYLSAGAQVASASGYRFTGRDYTNVPYFGHDKIGVADYEGTGDSGPCVSCHMETDQSHRFMPVEKTAGVITDITSTVCQNCHEGEHELSAGELEEESEKYQASLDALEVQLAAQGLHFCEAHPYFFTAADCNTAVTNWEDPDLDTTNEGNGKDNMGAAFNYNLLVHDPGGYAHNRIYSKRLIYDSIDWIDNFTLDDSVRATLDALDPGTNPYQAMACEYILSDATCDTGDRP